jgi:tryptophanyl-tRNA synthetase
MAKTIVSGIKPTGQIHIGNYAGMLKPALDLAKYSQNHTYYFIADYHALNSIKDPQELAQLIYEVVASYLALGLDPEKTVFYKQSDIPEIFEISHALSCVCPKGFMNRAHAYKSIVAERLEKGSKDPDAGINMGLFNYPILMAADILTFDADMVPVGKDQKQHIEYTKDLAIKFNNSHGDVFTVPEISIRDDVPILPGVDGQKMSKSYNNTIPIFDDPDSLRRAILRIKTDSKEPGEPKSPQESMVFAYYKEFASAEEVVKFEQLFADGISHGDAKEMLFEKMDHHLREPRRIFDELMKDKQHMKNVLNEGALKARETASVVLRRMRQAVGIF